MCRLVGIVASEVTEFGLVLKEAPRSLSRVSAVSTRRLGCRRARRSEAIRRRASAVLTENGWRIHKGNSRPAGGVIAPIRWRRGSAATCSSRTCVRRRSARRASRTRTRSSRAAGSSRTTARWKDYGWMRTDPPRPHRCSGATFGQARSSSPTCSRSSTPRARPSFTGTRRCSRRPPG